MLPQWALRPANPLSKTADIFLVLLAIGQLLITPLATEVEVTRWRIVADGCERVCGVGGGRAEVVVVRRQCWVPEGTVGCVIEDDVGGDAGG
jgi:hypothetical protein